MSARACACVCALLVALLSCARAGAWGGGAEHLSGIRRVRRLYCSAGIGHHLQILPSGSVHGAHDENPHTLLEIAPVERGVVTLYGVHSRLFVAMDSKGKLYGSTHYSSECKFRENLLANNYNAYESVAHPGMYIGLSKTGRAKRGNRVTTTMTATHFLPRLISKRERRPR